MDGNHQASGVLPPPGIMSTQTSSSSGVLLPPPPLGTMIQQQSFDSQIIDDDGINVNPSCSSSSNSVLAEKQETVVGSIARGNASTGPIVPQPNTQPNTQQQQQQTTVWVNSIPSDWSEDHMRIVIQESLGFKGGKNIGDNLDMKSLLYLADKSGADNGLAYVQFYDLAGAEKCIKGLENLQNLQNQNLNSNAECSSLNKYKGLKCGIDLGRSCGVCENLATAGGSGSNVTGGKNEKNTNTTTAIAGVNVNAGVNDSALKQLENFHLQIEFSPKKKSPKKKKWKQNEWYNWLGWKSPDKIITHSPDLGSSKLDFDGGEEKAGGQDGVGNNNGDDLGTKTTKKKDKKKNKKDGIILDKQGGIMNQNDGEKRNTGTGAGTQQQQEEDHTGKKNESSELAAAKLLPQGIKLADKKWKNWRQYQTAKGQKYYHNKKTGETQWFLPGGIEDRLSQVINRPINEGPLGANLAIFQIPASWHEMVIFQHFEVFGPILSLTLDRCPTTMKSKRMCYISFTELINAAKAKSAMSGFKVENKILAIQAAGNDYLAEKQILDHAVKKIQIDSKLKNAVVKDPNNILYERKKQHLEGVTGSAVKHDRKHRNLIQSVQVEVGAGAAIAGSGGAYDHKPLNTIMDKIRATGLAKTHVFDPSNMRWIGTKLENGKFEKRTDLDSVFERNTGDNLDNKTIINNHFNKNSNTFPSSSSSSSAASGSGSSSSSAMAFLNRNTVSKAGGMKTGMLNLMQKNDNTSFDQAMPNNKVTKWLTQHNSTPNRDVIAAEHGSCSANETERLLNVFGIGGLGDLNDLNTGDIGGSGDLYDDTNMSQQHQGTVVSTADNTPMLGASGMEMVNGTGGANLNQLWNTNGKSANNGPVRGGVNNKMQRSTPY